MAAQLIELNARRGELRGTLSELLKSAAGRPKGEQALNEKESEQADGLQSELDRVEATLKLEQKRLGWEREGATTTVPPSAPPADKTTTEDKNPWRSLGEFLAAVANVSIRGEMDPRLQPSAAASGMNTTVPSEGGFLVRQDFSTALLDKAMQGTVLAQNCSQIPIGDGFDGIELPYVDETSRATGSRWGGVQVFRRTEADTVTAKKPSIGKLEIRLEDLMAVCYLTGRGTQDATALEAIITNAFTSEFAFKLDDEIVNGTGAGQCLGILSSPALVTVLKEGGQAAGTIDPKNIQKIFARVPGRNLGNAKWYLNQEVWPQLFAMNQANMPIFLPGFNLASAPFGTLLGQPIVPNVEQLPGLTTKGDVLFADLSQYILIKKGGIDQQQSMHVRFLFDEMTYRFIQRVNGAPAWKTTLTPYKATAATALSPFVVVETR